MSRLEIGDTVKIAESSKYYDRGASNPTCEGVYNKDDGAGNLSHRVDWVNGVNDWYNLHDLILIKKGKTMQFTKSDLIKLSQTKTVVVEYRDGKYMFVWEGRVVGNEFYTLLSDIQDNLLAKTYRQFDIVAVYEAEAAGVIPQYLRGEHLKPIWERTEKTEAQKEMEVLQEQAKALQEQITKLQGKL
jgi:hypothetical protein